MMTSLVMTVMGPDRPGLVKSISDRVSALDGSWLESRMANLAGQFAGIVHLQVPSANADALVASLQELETLGLQVLVGRGRPADDSGPVHLLRLEIVGHDRAGIVRDISRCLSEQGVSIEALESERMCGSWSGECLFRATAQLRVPAERSPDSVRAALEGLANDLMVDLSPEAPGNA